MNFIKRKLKRLNISKRKILTVSLCLVVFVMSLGYAALSQHMDIDGIAQIDRNWIVKIVSITSSVTNGGVDTSHSFVGTTATLHASLPTTNATVKYEIVLENQGNITAKLSTIEKTEDTNYSITYEIEGVLEDTTILKPGETNKVIVTIKAQDGVTNLSNTTKDLMLGFDYVEKSTSLDNNSGNTTDNGYMAYQPGDAVMFDPGDGTERLFYVVSLNNTSASFSSGGDLTVELIAADTISNAAGASSASDFLSTYTSSWKKILSSRIPTMEELAKLSGYTVKQLQDKADLRDVMPDWLLSGITANTGSVGSWMLTSSKSGDNYYTLRLDNTGVGAGAITVELASPSTVLIKPIISVSKANLPSPSYPNYEVGDKVTLVDGSVWYVAKKTGQVDSMITLYSDTIVTRRVYDSISTTKYNPFSSTNIGYYIQNTYLPSIKTKLSTAGGNVTGISARLLSADEALDLYKVDNSLFQDTANAAPTWILPSDNGSLTFSQGIPGLLAVPSTSSGVNVRGVITTLKRNIKSIDLGQRIAKVNNIARSDANINFSKPASESGSTPSAYRERQYNTGNSIIFSASTSYYFGKSYTFNPTTGVYSLVTTAPSTWANMSSNYSTYPYTCKSTSSTGTCSTLYKLTSYVSSTAGLGYSFDRIPIERIFLEKTTPSGNSSFQYTSTSYMYATSYKFDSKNGTFELISPVAVAASDIPTKYTTYKYTCRSATLTNCVSLYEVTSLSGTNLLAKNHYTSYNDDAVTNSNGLGLYYPYDANTEDELSTYYFRGAAQNNYVKFGGFYWRIIRVNEDGSVRLIYQGTSSSSTGEAASIGSSSFNDTDFSNAYVGYMYGDPKGTTYLTVHANTNSSVIKQKIDTWYQNNLISYASYLADAGFCGDRSLVSGSGVGTTDTYYGAYKRLETNRAPQFSCPQTKDLYTLTSGTKGNKSLTYPIGLITADEIMYAGSTTIANVGSNATYLTAAGWTMTPYRYDDASNFASIYRLYVNPPLYVVRGTYSNETQYVRPVINIKPDVKTISGAGTSGNPYTFS